MLYHDLSYLPYFGLKQQLFANKHHNPEGVKQVLSACERTPGQRRTGQKVLAILQTEEAVNYLQNRDYQRLSRLQGQWLAGTEDIDPTLRSLRQLGAYLQAAAASNVPYQALEHIDKAEAQLRSLENLLLQADSFHARALHERLPRIAAAVQQHRNMQESAGAAAVLPNPFRIGAPIAPDLGHDLFRGRDSAAQRIEALLADSSQHLSLAVFGPRRCGKSSLLRMLPVLLPDSLCVFFDLQDNSADDVAGLFRALQRCTREAAQKQADFSIPPYPDGSPFESFSQWLQDLDAAAQQHGRRVLLCIDEFERFPALFPGDKAAFIKLLSLFRATIQHRRYVRLLVSGIAPFSEGESEYGGQLAFATGELSRLWSDHFINTREIRIGHFDHDTSVDLLRRPIEIFPASAFSDAIAGEIFQRSGGLPYLLQLYANTWVQDMNQRQMPVADMSDLPRIEDNILSNAGYFSDVYLRTTAAQQSALRALALGEVIDLDAEQLRWLKRRCLLSESGSALSIPILARWIQLYEAGEVF